MVGYSNNYQLHQWEAGDDFLREDFNQDFQRIDAALGEKSGILFGTYTGDGSEWQDVNLGYCPKAVAVFPQDQTMVQTDRVSYRGFAGPAGGTRFCDFASVELTESGFRVFSKSVGGTYGGTIGTNAQSKRFFYCAIS